MADTDPAGPVMDRDEVDRALARLGQEHEAIETSLLALQDHAGRRLLEGARLTGVTAERWTSTEAAITLLWTYFDAYTDVLRRAREIRARRRWSSREDLVELTELLRGEPVTVAGGAAATANALTLHGGQAGPGVLSERYSLSTLVDRMNELYATSLDMVVAADAVWSALPARIDLLSAELRRTSRLAHSVGVRPGEHPAGDDLERVTRTLKKLREQVVSDPLGFWKPAEGSSAPGGGKPDTTVYDREARALEDVRREIDAVLAVRQDAEKRIVRLRDVLSRADRTLAEARTARGEVLAKIAATEVPVVSGPPTALQEQLSTAAEYRRHAGSGGAGSNRSGHSGRSSRTSSQSSKSRRSVSGRLSRSLSGRTSTGRSVSVRSSGSGGGSSGRGRLGAGLVQVLPIPRPDPRRMVLDNPEVPERKRFCSRSDCGAPVGRARNGRPGRTEGFCTKCGHPYSFVPKLRPGDVVHGQYEVVGCLAHGGLGWIYLAVDRAVADRWVVLKGLLDTGDQDAMAAAISERRFLAEIEHANIVRIYNFVEHLDQRTGSLDGYIVMEYVGGKSLKEIANGRRTPEGRRDPLPVEQACAYGIEALEALGHLHSRNLLYCDFKVDNAIQTEDQLKLIDMGAVRRTDDEESAIYGTVGYQAPEVAEVGPSVASDLYTVARTLAVLTFDFQGYTTVYADSLPDPDTIEVFRQYESFYRLLVRATDPDPARRFASAQEMAEQLTGVLREVVSLQSGQARPALSTLFGPELRVTDTELFPALDGDVSRLGARRTRTRKGASVPAPALPPSPASLVRPVDCPTAALALPVPHVQPTDPNAGFLAGLLASAPGELIHALAAVPDPSAETRLRAVRARLETGEWATALEALAALEAEDADDWRVVWYRGVAALVTGDHEGAALAFDAIYDAFPGEIAPKLALGLCAEVLGQLDNAAEYYRLVWSTDPSYVSAAFGLARVQLAAGDRHGAVRTLESVPESSVHCTAARVAAVRARLRGRTATAADVPFLDDLAAAAGQVEALESYGLDPARRELLAAEVLGCGLDWVLSGGQGSAPPAAGGRTLLGGGLDERGLRFGLERSYRTLARLARSGEERIDLVERANRYRPRTWV